MNRRDFHILTLSATAWAVTGPSWAQNPLDEYTVKVGYLYKFCNYVEWPSHVVPKTFTIGVIGPALDVPDTIATIRQLNGQTLQERKFVLREFATLENYEPCDMVYVTGSDAASLDLLAKLAAMTEKKPVLIVGEVPNGIKQGAVINLVRVGQNIKFEVNQAAALKAELKIHAKLLRLAVNKDPEPRPGDTIVKP